MIAGVDYSTRAVDVVLLDEDSDAATWHRFPLFGSDAFERSRSVRQGLAGSLWDDIMAVGIEEPRGYGAGSLYRVQGAILSCIPNSLLVHPLIPSQWRKTVGLPGNASKEAIAAFANSRLGIGVHAPFTHYSVDGFPWPQDALDAYCIALATRTLIQKVAA